MKEGNEDVPFCFLNMSTEEHIKQIEALVKTMLNDEPQYYLVQVRIKPTNNLKVFIDGDQGISIERCVQFNRKLYKVIEEKGFYPDGNFSLELSSPGVDEPLRLHRQYTKNIGRFIEIIFIDGTKKEGKLVQVAESDIIIETTEGKGKKVVAQQLVIPFNNIKTTTVQIKF